MPVLKRDGTPRAPRRTKAQMQRDQGARNPVTTRQMTEAIREYMIQYVGATKKLTEFDWIHPERVDTSFRKAPRVWYQNGAVHAHIDDWGLIFVPMIHLNTITVRIKGNRKSGALKQCIDDMARDLPWLSGALSVEHNRVSSPDYIYGSPLEGLKVDRGDPHTPEDIRVGQRLELGVTPPPTRKRTRKK